VVPETICRFAKKRGEGRNVTYEACWKFCVSIATLAVWQRTLGKLTLSIVLCRKITRLYWATTPKFTREATTSLWSKMEGPVVALYRAVSQPREACEYSADQALEEFILDFQKWYNETYAVGDHSTSPASGQMDTASAIETQDNNSNENVDEAESASDPTSINHTGTPGSAGDDSDSAPSGYDILAMPESTQEDLLGKGGIFDMPKKSLL
jgi:hypothetical protein